ncbi:MAG: HlyD family efflux transporter periplasmic adaptor subunit [Myxococcales bacterium]|nr:HlyD family efflux transporter periplasmic adaptor subunit [Myxococcales bacterium]
MLVTAPNQAAPVATAAMDKPRGTPALRRRRAVLSIAIAVLLILGLTAGLSFFPPAAPTVERAGVWIDTVKRGSMVRQVQGNGTLVPEKVRVLSAVSEARVERIVVQPGTRVGPDTVVLELSNPDLELRALEAERRLASALAELESLRATQRDRGLAQRSVVAAVHGELGQARRQAAADATLARRGFVSDLEMAQSRGKADELQTRLGLEHRRLAALRDGMGAQLAAQRAHLKGLQAVAEFRRRQAQEPSVRAGVEGVVQELPLQVGQWVAPGTVLGRVAQPERLRAELRIAEFQAKDVQVGQTASVDIRSGVIPGTVTRVDPAVVAGAVRVEVTLADPSPPGARPELSVQATIELERLEDVLFVGRPAFVQGQSPVGVYRVVEGGHYAERTAVDFGRTSVRTVEIRNGLHEGDQVILSDMSRWDSNERIRLQ